MSGGVDSAAAAQLALDAGDEVRRRHARAVVRPGRRRRALVLLAAGGGRRPRARPPDGPPARDARPARALPRRGRRPLRRRLCRRPHARTPACAATARSASTRCSSSPTRLGAARLATGHYARIARDGHGPLIRAARDARKDQSYMLARLDPALLDRLSFPLGGLTKDAVRALARDAGLPVADKRESQDLCFVAGLGSRAFLRRHGGPRLRRPGEIVDEDGRVLGRHDGQHEFTVGQRRGLEHRRPGAALRAAQGRRDQPRHRRAAGGARDHAACCSRTPGSTARRPGRAGAAALPRASRCRAARARAPAARSSSSWTSRPMPPRPGSWPA